jgi:DNA-binding Xre family transcriptional regulator
MPNRSKDVELTQIVARNLQKICKEHDLSSNDLSKRAEMPQKTVWSIMSGTHNCRIDNLEKICKTLLVSPTAIVTPHLPTNILMSRRIPRIIEKYTKLPMEDRDRVEAFIDSLTENEET